MPWRSLLVWLALSPLAAGTARATETLNVSIRATVLAACRFATSAPSAAMDPRSSRAEEGSAVITYRCAKGVAPGYALAVDVTCPTCPGVAEVATSLAAPGEAMGGGMGPGNDRTVVVRIAPDTTLTAATEGTVKVSLSP